MADDTGTSLFRAAMNQLQLSARAFHRVLTCACATGAGKLARTIADLADSESTQSEPAHIAGAAELNREPIDGARRVWAAPRFTLALDKRGYFS